MEKIILVDGHNLLFRIFFGFNRPIMHHGIDRRCQVGFASSINKMVKDLGASKLLVLFDSVTSTKSRLEVYPDYKQNRIDYTEQEENPFEQLGDIYKVLDELDIAFLEADGFEADDYIATICKKHHDDYEFVIVSTDSDFNQLVSESVSIYKSRGKNSEILTPISIKEKLGVSPEQIIEYKSLVGDTADNIPGIKGIGPKRAAEILSYGTIDEIISGQTEIPDKYLNKIRDHEDILVRNRFLITMMDNAPVDLNLNDLEVAFEKSFKPTSVLKFL
ncbi:5'-3' exonuclease [Acidaminobacter sp. JC074]|uniref:5'-3' exonuclease n=1 Tax=Acidaminobacter sp. JC074 TaxID=2530199 RepID=UPI001F0F5DBF|nr:5'-3' exonuclease [Acidaminobacter sp. JC074]